MAELSKGGGDRRVRQFAPFVTKSGELHYQRHGKDGAPWSGIDLRGEQPSRAHGILKAITECYAIPVDAPGRTEAWKRVCEMVGEACGSHDGDTISREQAIGALDQCGHETEDCRGACVTTRHIFADQARQALRSLPSIARDPIEAEYRDAAVALAQEMAPISGDYKPWRCQVCAEEWEGDIGDHPHGFCEWPRFASAKAARDAR